jgi:hypothetical protein
MPAPGAPASASTAVGAAMVSASQAARVYQRTSTTARATAPAEVSHHLARQIANQTPFGSSGRAQLAKTRMATWAAKNAATWRSGRTPSGSGSAMAVSTRSCSERLKMRAMRAPTTSAKSTALTARAAPSLAPRTLAVSTMASTLMAGPEYRNAMAGPSPAPIWWIPANSGSTVHEHTARMVPLTEATP